MTPSTLLGLSSSGGSGSLLSGSLQETPYIVQLREDGDLISCCGTILSSLLILTAAHCVNISAIRNLRVIAGDNVIRRASDTFGQVRSVSTAFIHEEYNASTKLNDIAILRLSAPFEFSDAVQRADVSSHFYAADLNRNVEAIGWGMMLEWRAGFWDDLRTASFPILPTLTCSGIYKYFDPPSQLCAGREGSLGWEAATCFVNSGGPLICQQEDGLRYVCGLASYTTEFCGLRPAVYTRIDRYWNWINGHLQCEAGNGSCDKARCSALNRLNCIGDTGSYADSCTVVDETFGADNGAENRDWYFRQDVFASAHHYFFHAYYVDNVETKPERADRRGELFYFMHREFLARNNVERQSSGLGRTAALAIVPGTPLEGFKSHLNQFNAKFNYSDRDDGTPLSDVSNSVYNLSVSEVGIRRDRILEAIQNGFILHENGTEIPLDNPKGIDYLVDITQSAYSVNPWLYGSSGVHNSLHNLIANAMNPMGLRPDWNPDDMINPSTSFRDPIFAQVHQTVENIFRAHKDRLEPYTPNGGEFPLEWAGVRITDLRVQSLGRDTGPNQLSTFWAFMNFNLTYGLDWRRSGPQLHQPVPVCSKHLDYDHFEYTITLEVGPKVTSQEGTVRIFLGPRYDEWGRRYSLEEQRPSFFTLDRFTTNLTEGLSVVRRLSGDSALLTPVRNWLGDLGGSGNLCGCGWPEHLLLPKGSPSGTTFDLFVMVTNGAEDRVEMDLSRAAEDSCDPAPVWCGLKGQKYPDSKPMGYPFDRKVRVWRGDYLEEPETLEQLVNSVTNMQAIQVKISHRPGIG